MTDEINELDQLATAAAAVDNMAEAGADMPAAAPEAPPVDPAAEVAALLSVVAGILSPLFPCLPGIYSEATCRKLGEAAAPVLAKYDVSVGGMFDRWGAEITLAAVALPVAIATAQGVKADMAARRKKAAADKPEQHQEQEPAGTFRLGESG